MYYGRHFSLLQTKRLLCIYDLKVNVNYSQDLHDKTRDILRFDLALQVPFLLALVLIPRSTVHPFQLNWLLFHCKDSSGFRYEQTIFCSRIQMYFYNYLRKEELPKFLHLSLIHI